METNFNFKSQIATSRSQSERLLSLGLKKETADMVYTYEREEHGDYYYWNLEVLEGPWDSFIWPSTCTYIPAWSLHRLIDLMPKSIHFENEDWYKIIYNNSMCYQRGRFSICRSCKGDLYEDIANCIEWLIKEGYFNKEYLV